MSTTKKKPGLLARARELAAEAVAKAVLRLTGQPLAPRPQPALTPPPLSHATPVAVKPEERKPRIVPIAGGASPSPPPPPPDSRPRPPTAPSHAPHEATPEHDQPKEPLGMLDLEEVPETYGIDEVGLLVRDPHWMVAYWEVTSGAWERARAELHGDGALTLRLLVFEGLRSASPPTEQSSAGPPGQVVHQERLPWDHGRRGFRPPRVGARVSAQVGLLAGDGRFAVMAEAPRVTVPPIESAPGEITWMAVDPAGRPGERPRIRATGDAAHVAAAVGGELSDRRVAWLASRAAGAFTPVEIPVGWGSSAAPAPVVPPELPSSPVRNAPSSSSRPSLAPLARASDTPPEASSGGAPEPRSPKASRP